MKFDYRKDYTPPIDKAYLEKQFRIYDAYVKEYYDPRELLAKFNGISYNEKGEEQRKISYLSDTVFFGDTQVNFCSPIELNRLITGYNYISKAGLDNGSAGSSEHGF